MSQDIRFEVQDVLPRITLDRHQVGSAIAKECLVGYLAQLERNAQSDVSPLELEHFRLAFPRGWVEERKAKRIARGAIHRRKLRALGVPPGLCQEGLGLLLFPP